MKTLKILSLNALLLSMFVVGGAHAQASMDAGNMGGMKMDKPAAAPASSTSGEVRKIDKAARKITLKHGPIKNLDMPGMTMAFGVADPKMLDNVKEGDKVTFTADKVGDAIVVTKIEAAK